MVTIDIDVLIMVTIDIEKTLKLTQLFATQNSSITMPAKQTKNKQQNVNLDGWNVF